MGIKIWDNFSKKYSDPRTQEWFLSSPISLLIILIVYVWICVYLGPKLMKSKKAYKLIGFLRYYNFFILGLNGGLAFYFVYFEVVQRYSPICQPVNTLGTNELMVARGVYVFFWSKILELTDSVVMIMKKKTDQQANLHYYHHASMLINAWLGVRFVPGGSTAIIATINAFFHFVTYLYYHISSFNCGCRMDNFKDATTFAQLIQFGLVILHCATASFKRCGYPQAVLSWVIIYVVSFLLLFCLYIYKLEANANNGTPSDKKHSRSTAHKRHTAAGAMILNPTTTSTTTHRSLTQTNTELLNRASRDRTNEVDKGVKIIQNAASTSSKETHTKSKHLMKPILEETTTKIESINDTNTQKSPKAIRRIKAFSTKRNKFIENTLIEFERTVNSNQIQ